MVGSLVGATSCKKVTEECKGELNGMLLYCYEHNGICSLDWWNDNSYRCEKHVNDYFVYEKKLI